MGRIADVARERGVYFIAELGQNHQGSLTIAKEMVDSLVGMGVAAIKTAKRDIDTCLPDELKSMPYLNHNSFGATYYEHRKALELSEEDFNELKEYSEARGFDFISSFTDAPSLRFLSEIGVDCLKIASQRVADLPLLQMVAEMPHPVILSTGMSSIDDVDRAVSILEGRELWVLQCTSTYLCDVSETDLRVLQTYVDRYGDRISGVGFSGHHGGIAPDLASFMMGSQIIERHYTLDRAMTGSDHAASIERRGVELIMRYIRQMRAAIGSGQKTLYDSERSAMRKLRTDLDEGLWSGPGLVRTSDVRPNVRVHGGRTAREVRALVTAADGRVGAAG